MSSIGVVLGYRSCCIAVKRERERYRIYWVLCERMSADFLLHLILLIFK